MSVWLQIYLLQIYLLASSLCFLKAREQLKIKIGLGCTTQETERNLMSCLRIPQCLDSVFFFSRYIIAVSIYI